MKSTVSGLRVTCTRSACCVVTQDTSSVASDILVSETDHFETHRQKRRNPSVLVITNESVQSQCCRLPGRQRIGKNLQRPWSAPGVGGNSVFPDRSVLCNTTAPGANKKQTDICQTPAICKRRRQPWELQAGRAALSPKRAV